MKNEDLYRVDRPDIDHIPRGDMEAWRPQEAEREKQPIRLDHEMTRLVVILMASFGILVHAFSGTAFDAVVSLFLFGGACYGAWRLPTIEERWTRHIDNVAAVMMAAIDSTDVRNYRPYRKSVFHLFVGSWAVSVVFMFLLPSISGASFVVSMLCGIFLIVLAVSKRSLGDVRVVGRQITILVAGHGTIGLIADQGGFVFLLVALLLLLLDKNQNHLYEEEG